MNRACLIFLSLAVFLSLSAMASGHEVEILHKGQRRWCEVRQPESPGPWPLIVALHGGGGDPAQFERSSGLTAAALPAGVMVAYPAGTGRLDRRLLTWNAGNCCARARDLGVDDVGFLSRLIDLLVAEHGADPRRVLVTGMSNGAMMSHRMGCEAAGKVTAIAPVAGALNLDDCRPSRPLSVFIVHGTADRHVLYEGGKPEVRVDKADRVDNSVAYAKEFWRKANRCPSISQTSDRGAVRRETFGPCAGGVSVTTVTLVGHGHAWPGGRTPRRLRDEPLVDWPASQALVRLALSLGRQ